MNINFPNFKILFKTIFFSSIIIFLFLLGCSKKRKNLNLAKNYYELAVLEIAEVQGQKSLKSALFFINKALFIDSFNSKFLAFKGSILLKLGFKDNEVINCFELALTNVKNDNLLKNEILNNYACLLAKRGNEKKALDIWNKLSGNKDYLTPEVAMFNEAKFYFIKQSWNISKEKLLNIVKMEPDFVDARFYLALNYLKLNEESLLKNELKTILYLEPNHRGAKDLLDQIDL